MTRTPLPPGGLPGAYRLNPDDVARKLGVQPEQGLSSSRLPALLDRYGPNELSRVPPVPAWRRFLAQFQDTLVLLLLGAVVISVGLWFYERDTALPYEGLTILAILLLNAVLGYVQEARAEQAVAALKAMSAASAQVMRDGQVVAVPAREVVPGDVVVLQEGDAVPADARLIQAVELSTLEASLTGESLPVKKDIQPMTEEAVLGDQRNMVFAGSALSSGHGRAIVTATGMHTALGQIAGLLQETAPESTPLQRELDVVGKRLGGVVLGIAVVMILTLLLVNDVRTLAGVADILILGVALAVAAVPEGLPAITSAVLALGMQRMARRNAIVRSLPAVETLGSATVIASDKTGTLTRNEMTVRAVVTASGVTEVGGVGYEPVGAFRRPDQSPVSEGHRQELERLLTAAALNNNAALRQADGQWLISGDPTEGALIVAARKAGLELEHLNTRWHRLAERPFTAERKSMSTLYRDTDPPGELVLFSKGAPDVLLQRCISEWRDGQAVPLTELGRAHWHDLETELASQAFRTLGVASRRAAQTGRPLEELEQDLTWLGLLGMLDPPREEVKESIALTHRAGIRTIMITGDHPLTAGAIASELGIAPAPASVVTGQQLAALSDAELDRVVGQTSVYARVNPEHKLRIVRALRRDGEVVAMTGDGVNDAPALKAADIGVAMGITGTDVSKEAADIVLADDHFNSIVSAVREGRTIFGNIRKFLRYLLSSNIGEVLTMFLGVLFAGLLGLHGTPGEVVLPLLAVHILWINLVTDGAPALALGLERARPGVMKRPPRPKHQGVITAAMWRGIFLSGLTIAVGTLAVLDASLPGGLIAGGGDLTYGRTMAFTTLMFFQVFNVFNARSDWASAFQGMFRNRWLWGALLLSVALQGLVVEWSPLQQAFSTTALGLRDWLTCAVVASSVIWVREAEKWLVRRLGQQKHKGPGPITAREGG